MACLVLLSQTCRVAVNMAFRGGPSRRSFSFSFPGPRQLDDIIKRDKISEKSGAEIADLWYSYHEDKERVFGLTMKGKDGPSVLVRARDCPFFVHPVFRDEGFFMMVSQFQAPCHFLLTYLEDYKMDPSSATPLLTVSVFDDLCYTKDITLIRCDVLNNSLEDDEARKVVESLLENYRKEDDYTVVEGFNKNPDSFDIDDFISRMNDRWTRNTTNAG